MSGILGITPDEGKYYKSTLATDYAETIVKVGSQDKFVPNINASKWDDEAWLNINMPEVVNTETETFAQEKIELTVGNNTHRFYELDKDKFEYEIEFTARPPSDTVSFNLDFPKGLDFLYQDTLYNYWLNGGDKAHAYATFEEFQAHGGRPENVERSYAVYWNKKNNQYQTGKFCHIYRPKLTDADRKETWAEINITGKVMTITMDKVWLDKAVYPVILDPTLGYDTSGSSWYGAAGEKYGTFYETDGTGGDVVNIYLGVYQIAGSNQACKWGLWDAPSSGNSMVGEDLLEQHEWDPVSTGTNETASGTESSLSASSWYCMAYTPEDSDTQIRYDDGGGRGAYNTGLTYASEMQDPAESGWDNASSDRDTIYLTYEPAAGGETIGCTVADGIVLSDSNTNIMTLQAAIADGMIFSDSNENLKQLIAALADGITLSDTSAIVATLQAALADGVTLSDAATVLATLQAALADGTKLSDTPTVLATLQAATADGTVYSDSSTIGKLVAAAIAEGVTFSDSTTIVKTIAGIVSDGIKLSDTFSAFITLLASVADGTIFSDSVTATSSGNIAAAIAEGIVFSDSSVALATFQAAIAEGAIFSDTASVYKLLSGAAQDGLTLSDSAAAGFTLLAQLADGVTLSDSGTVKATFSVTAQDGV